jgi:DNA polymerase-3 subunit epsilon
MLAIERLFGQDAVMATVPGQRGFDDLGTPLHEVTFCVIDLETTGGSADRHGITEVGAVKLRGGECLGTFQTLVNPGQPVPPSITVLTGITQAMVLPAPPIEQVLPSLLEFAAGSVIVGHNVRFDVSFLDAALQRCGRPRLDNRRLDTCALARRLVRDEVPNCKLGTLAQHLRLSHQPDHRALHDALATGDLLHVLLERAAGLGVTGLDDLLELPTMSGHAQASKLRLTTSLPRAPGVYLFRDRGGRVLYVGKATNLRARVRSYFSGDDRRKVGQLLREAQAVDHVVCTGPLEAAVLEVRLIRALQPRFNRQAKDWGRYHYLRLTRHEPFPRLSVVRTARADGDLYLGPLASAATAKRVAEAIESVVPLRRCTAKIGATPTRTASCAPAQLGVAACPCAGTVDDEAYGAIVATAVRGLTVEPHLLLEPLAARMAALAASRRFEEAADARERAAALATAIARQRRLQRLRDAGRLVVHVDGEGGAELDHGLLVRSWGPGGPGAEHLPGLATAGRADLPDLAPDPVDLAPPAPGTPIPRHLVDELACVARWIDERAHRVRIEHCDVGLASPLPALPSFQPRRADRRQAA